MTVGYQLVKDEEFSGATIFVNGETFTVASDNPYWEQIVQHLITGVDDDARLVGMIQPAKAASDALLRITERVTFKAGTLYFDGDVLENALADHIVKIIESGADEKDYMSFGLFLEKLSTNPSKKSRKHLYSFIETHGMTVSDDGDLIAYKGVNSDGSSINAGYGIVDGIEYGAHENGRITESASLPNHIGAVVEIPRSLVDDDRDRGCSTGLHAGTYDYAKGFARGRLLTVKVNPRDVVSVPRDSYNAKIRTARYVVLEENQGNITTPTYATTREPVVSVDDDFAPSEYQEAQVEDEALIGAPEDSGEAVPGPDSEEFAPQEQWFGTPEGEAFLDTQTPSECRPKAWVTADADGNWGPAPKSEGAVEPADATVSDDDLADVLEGMMDKADEDGGSVTINLTYVGGRDAKGHFVKGADNPGKKVKRDKNGKFKKSKH